MKEEQLRQAYEQRLPHAQKLRQTITEQLLSLFSKNEVTLGVPMESRVKEWQSIEEKLQRKRIHLSDITELNDFVGVRVILLFLRDLTTVDKLIGDTFTVLSKEDTSARLDDGQFGYKSQHYQLRLPETWSAVPSMSGLTDLTVELQVRTLAQHIWAAASHKLQYKNENGVPPPIRRTIYRVSALLETVDLEFDRVLAEREEYRATNVTNPPMTEQLNVEILISILDDILPAANKKELEPYATLLDELMELGVSTTTKLKEILKEHIEKILEVDRKKVALHRASHDFNGISRERIALGVFFSHVGLVRQILKLHFGDKKFVQAMNHSGQK